MKQSHHPVQLQSTKKLLKNSYFIALHYAFDSADSRVSKSFSQLHISHLFGLVDAKLCRAYYSMEYFLMAKFGDWNMVSLRLTGQSKTDFAEYVRSSELTWIDVLERILGKGYSVKYSWIDDKTAYCVSVSGKKEGGKNPRTTLISMSDTLEEATFMALFKIEVVCDNGSWIRHESEQDSWG